MWCRHIDFFHMNFSSHSWSIFSPSFPCCFHYQMQSRLYHHSFESHFHRRCLIWFGSFLVEWLSNWDWQRERWRTRERERKGESARKRESERELNKYSSNKMKCWNYQLLNSPEIAQFSTSISKWIPPKSSSYPAAYNATN